MPNSFLSKDLKLKHAGLCIHGQGWNQNEGEPPYTALKNPICREKLVPVGVKLFSQGPGGCPPPTPCVGPSRKRKREEGDFLRTLTQKMASCGRLWGFDRDISALRGRSGILQSWGNPSR